MRTGFNPKTDSIQSSSSYKMFKFQTQDFSSGELRKSASNHFRRHLFSAGPPVLDIFKRRIFFWEEGNLFNLPWFWSPHMVVKSKSIFPKCPSGLEIIVICPDVWSLMLKATCEVEKG